jgi:hypothetical protein
MRPLESAVLALLVAAAAAHAGDLTIRQRSTTSAGGKTQTREEMQYVHGNLLVIDAPDSRTIVDVDAKTMTVADKAKKAYFVMTFDDMRRQGEAVRDRVQKMPPEVRSMLEQMMGSGGPVTLKPTGKHETIAGYKANEQSLSGGPFHGSIWTTDAIALPEGVRKWRELAAAATAEGGPGRPLAEALARVPGVPLRTSMTATVGATSFTRGTEVLEASTKSPPAEALRLPPGYTKGAPPPFQ